METGSAAGTPKYLPLYVESEPAITAHLWVSGLPSAGLFTLLDYRLGR